MCLEDPKFPDYFRATAGVLGVPFPLQEHSQGPPGRDEGPCSSRRDRRGVSR